MSPRYRISGCVALAVVGALLPLEAAHAELPASVRAMIEEAIERGDEDTVRTVIDLARATNPDEGDEIDAILAGYENDLAAANAAQALAEQQAIREAGLFDNWSGRGELGAFAASGNAENTGVTASIQLTREGIDWRHKVNARADFQSTEGVTTREQYFAAYEPNLKLGERLFLYALAQYERDRFQGFSARYAVSGGLGYQIFDNDAVTLSAKAGPAYRITQFVDGGSEDALAALVGLDFDWRITERLTLTQDTDAVAEAGGSATAIVDGSNTSLNLVTGLNAKISDNLSARLSYAYEYDSNPPAGAQSTDTLSRITIIYDF